MLMFCRHRRFRKAVHAGLQPKAILSYHPIEEREARIFLKQVQKNPADFRNGVKRYTMKSLTDTLLIVSRRYTAGVILGTMYGHRVHEFESDRFAPRVFKSASRFAGTLAPGAFLVDVLPWIRYLPSWVPGMSWRKSAAAWAREDNDLYTELREEARVIVFTH